MKRDPNLRLLIRCKMFLIGCLVLILILMAIEVIAQPTEYRKLELAAHDCYAAGQRAALIHGAIECLP